MTVTDSPFMVSAPGKVIIFGEHASVYGKPAIAAALSLRSYLMVTKSRNPKEVTLQCPDIKLNKTWNIDEFPWDATVNLSLNNQDDDESICSSTTLKSTAKSSNASLEELVPDLVTALTNMLIGVDSIQFSASYAFLYLYVNLCNVNVPGYVFTVRSTLPVGAGLGSSASIGVCFASAMALLGGHISIPTMKYQDLITSESKDSQLINDWAFLAEKCIHGNPSGIDNTVACFGGAVMFQRIKSTLPNIRTSMRNFPSLKLLLTNTKQPRRTADLVSKVSVLMTNFPKSSSSILDAIDHITKEGYKLMIRPFFDHDAKTRFRELIRMNHGLLVSLGVSHPTLEKIKICCDELQIGDTKLTGAGGGGCAITLLKDDLDEESVKVAKISLESHGFETFETSLGGKGVAFIDNIDLQKFEFSSEEMIRLGDRKSIEAVIGVEANSNCWSFW